MHKSQKECIRSNLDRLVEYTECNSKFLAILESRKVLHSSEAAELGNSSLSMQERTKRLYAILQKRADSLPALLEALRQTYQSGAYKVFESTNYCMLSKHKSVSLDKANEKPSSDNRISIFKGTFGIRKISAKLYRKDYQDLLMQADNEINILTHLDWHKNIIRFFIAKVVILEEQQQFAVVLDDTVPVSEFVKTVPNSDHSTKMNLCLQVLEGVGHLHKHNVLHLDIDSDTFSVCNKDSSTPTIKIGEFAASKLLNKNEMEVKMCVEDIKRKASYFTPEILKKHSDEKVSKELVLVSYKTDIFCTAILIYYVLSCGGNPFGIPLIRMYKMVHEPPAFTESMTSALQNIFLRLLAKSPSDRPTIFEATKMFEDLMTTSG